MNRTDNCKGPVGAQRARLKEVADAAGVSRSTVSLVLRDSKLVAPSTRARVEAALVEANYVYDRSAARLRTGMSQTIGLIVSEITNPFYAELTAGIEAVLDEAGWLAFLANSGDQPERQERFIRRIREQGADGVILGPAEGTVRTLPIQLRQQGFACVQMLRHLGERSGDYVGPDYAMGMALAVEHLVGRGHSRIGYVRSQRRTSATLERLTGLEAAFARHRVSPGPIVACAGSRLQAASLVADLLSAPDPPTALLCHNDVIAFGVLSGLNRLGLQPGRDVAVIGFDNIAEAASSVPALSTVATRPVEVGTEAARLLLRRIADPDGAPEWIILPPRLVLRET